MVAVLLMVREEVRRLEVTDGAGYYSGETASA
jgi:hypothetical protein